MGPWVCKEASRRILHSILAFWGDFVITLQVALPLKLKTRQGALISIAGPFAQDEVGSCACRV